MLRKGLTTLGLIGDWNQEKATGNPAASVAVKQYQLMLREEQARAGVTQRSAALLMREDSFCQTVTENECLAHEPSIITGREV